MCYYNGIKVTKTEFERLIRLELILAHLREGLAIYKGFDYNMFPVKYAAATMNMALLDHIILTKDDVFSFADKALL